MGSTMPRVLSCLTVAALLLAGWITVAAAQGSLHLVLTPSQKPTDLLAAGREFGEVLAKLYSEAIEGIDPGPVDAITATGASRLQILRFGVLPQVLPDGISSRLRARLV
jgi:ABC-type amino acid transport system permease subunit